MSSELKRVDPEVYAAMQAEIRRQNDGLELIAREDNGDTSLCVYIVAADTGAKGSVDELRRYLSGVLPEYMVPAYFVELEAMPLTANGKIDRDALPEPRLTRGDRYVAPHTQTETELVDIWADILHVEPEVIGRKKEEGEEVE